MRVIETFIIIWRLSVIVRPNSQFYPAPAAPPWRWAFALGGLRPAPDEAYRRWGLTAQLLRARRSRRTEGASSLIPAGALRLLKATLTAAGFLIDSFILFLVAACF